MSVRAISFKHIEVLAGSGDHLHNVMHIVVNAFNPS